MSSGTRRNSVATLGLTTRRSASLKRSSPRNADNTRHTEKMRNSKRGRQTAERKSYPLRNIKPAQKIVEQRKPKERSCAAKKEKETPRREVIVCVSENSDDSDDEVQLDLPTSEKERDATPKGVEVVVVSSDEDAAHEQLSEDSVPITSNVEKSDVTEVQEVPEFVDKKQPVNISNSEVHLVDKISSVESGSKKSDNLAVEIKEIEPDNTAEGENHTKEEVKSDEQSVAINTDSNSSIPDRNFKFVSDVVPNDSQVKGQLDEVSSALPIVSTEKTKSPSAEITQEYVQNEEDAKISDLVTDKDDEPITSDLYNHITEDASMTSSNMPERPISSNSRSTTSQSSIAQQDINLYSPGSTDLSISEDSRGSFKESGSEKALPTRKHRGRLKNRFNPRAAKRTKRNLSHVSSSCSPSEDGSVEALSRRSKRLPCRVGLVWEIGHRLEAVDHNQCRYPAKIIEVDKDACEVLIHFEGWSARFDEWVPMDSPKLRPPSTPSTKLETKEKQSGKQQYKANEKILARWNDGKMYEAKVTQVLPDGYYMVLFYDGFTKRLPISAMRKLNDKTVKERRLFHPVILPTKTEEVRKPPVTPAPKKQAAQETPTHSASKQFVVETDHNQFKCTYEGCSKGFRKEVLLQSHIRHYHSLDKDHSDVSGRASPVSPRRLKSRVRNVSESQSKTKEPATIKEVVETPKEDAAESKSEKEAPPNESGQNITSETVPEIKCKLEDPSCETAEVAPVVPTEEGKATLPEKQVEVKVERPPVKVVRKAVYPITKMETRHAKPCLFRDDSIYTGYISYRSLYTKGSRGTKKTVDTEAKKPRTVKTEDEKQFGEPKKRRRRVFKKFTTSKRHRTDYADDDDVSEGKRRRMDRVSESSIKTDETTRDSMDYDDNEDDDETVSDQQEANDDEIVRCICENEEENGLMFQCEDCKTWQHAACFNIENEEDVPETYFCYVCIKTKAPPPDIVPGETDSWFNNGVLASFNFVKDKAANTSRPNAILATHELVDSTKKVLVILRSLDHKIQIAGSDSHPDLKRWSKPWKQGITNSLPKRTLSTDPHSIASQSTAESDNFLVFDHAYFSHSDAAIDFQEEVVIEQPQTTETNLELPVATSSDVSVPDVEKKPVQLGPESKEKFTRKRGSNRESGRGRGARWRESHLPPAAAEEIVDPETCKNHLLEHVQSVQNDLESGLDLIESQLNLLEAEMGVTGPGNDGNLAPMLKSLKHLSKDLDVVQRFTFL